MIESATHNIANDYRKALRRAYVIRWAARTFWFCLALVILWAAL